jgi:hypothetical protein
LIDGRTLTEADFASVSLLPLADVVELEVEGVTLKVDVAAGERVNFFTRHTVPVGNDALTRFSVPVYEIRKDDKTLCRLYAHPEKGPLLTSQDLYF